MARFADLCRRVSGVFVLGAMMTACAVQPPIGRAQDEVVVAVVPATTPAANAPHPLTTVPGVKIGIGAATVGATPLAPLSHAALPGARVPNKRTSAPIKVMAPDGCNRAYGTAAQCIPLWAPGYKSVTCAYLTRGRYFDTPLVVVTDPLGLLHKKGVQTGTTADGKHTTVLRCID